MQKDVGDCVVEQADAQIVKTEVVDLEATSNETRLEVSTTPCMPATPLTRDDVMTRRGGFPWVVAFLVSPVDSNRHP